MTQSVPPAFCRPDPSTPIRIGARSVFSRTITQADLALYAGITGDFAPHHVNTEYAKRTRFGTTIAHGLLTASLVDGALAALFPQGSLSVRRELRFTAPARPGDTITATAEIVEVEEAGPVVTLTTMCTNQQGEVVVSGTATERIPLSENRFVPTPAPRDTRS